MVSVIEVGATILSLSIAKCGITFTLDEGTAACWSIFSLVMYRSGKTTKVKHVVSTKNIYIPSRTIEVPQNYSVTAPLLENRSRQGVWAVGDESFVSGTSRNSLFLACIPLNTPTRLLNGAVYDVSSNKRGTKRHMVLPNALCLLFLPFGMILLVIFIAIKPAWESEI